ncbi:hypothetical protein D3C81_1845300 [compost metagenome]
MLDRLVGIPQDEQGHAVGVGYTDTSHGISFLMVVKVVKNPSFDHEVVRRSGFGFES